MSEIEFSEEAGLISPVRTEEKPFLVRFLLRTGVVRSDRAAYGTLMGVAVCLFGAMVAILFIHSKAPESLDKKDVERIKQLQQQRY
jgi:hypothetical protein